MRLVHLIKEHGLKMPPCLYYDYNECKCITFKEDSSKCSKCVC